MKKIIINFSILIFLIIPAFVRAQIPFFPVPVVDPNVIGELEKLSRYFESLLTTTGESFKQVNVLLSKILETQFQQIASDVFVDLFKVHQYINNVAEIETFIEERKKKVADQETYSKALQEAQTAGAYLALQDFINRLDCVSPGIRNELAVCLSNTNFMFNLSPKAMELLDSIPDCFSEGTAPIVLKSNFFAWLTQPFKLNLGQVSENPPEEISPPPITITPAFQETENSIELNNLCAAAETMIQSSAQEKEEERKEEIGEIWPEEECSKIIVDKNIDGGKPLCLEYSTLISGKDMERFKQEVSLNNPLNNPAQSMEFFQSLNPYTLTQIGITTSSISTSSDPLSDLSTTTIKQKINKYCASYNLGPTERGESTSTDVKKVQTAYTECLNEFTNQYDQATELLQKDVEDRKDRAEKNQKDIENLIAGAWGIKGSIDPRVCPGAYKDLEEITQSLEAKNELYLGAVAKLTELSIQITGLRNLIAQIRSTIFGLLDEVFTLIQDILPFLDVNIEQFITNIINQLLSLITTLLTGINIPLPILSQIKIGPLKIDKDIALSKLTEIVINFDRILSPLVSIVLNYNRMYYELYRSKLTNASLLNDIYEFNLIRQKLNAYERLKETKECSSEGQPVPVVLLTKSRVVVESKKEQNRSFNFFALLRNLFEPKIVEFKNEK